MYRCSGVQVWCIVVTVVYRCDGVQVRCIVVTVVYSGHCGV